MARRVRPRATPAHHRRGDPGRRREGIAGLSHRTVAAEADVPLGSTTYHFATLDELLVAALRQANEGFAGGRGAAPLDPPDADLAAELARCWGVARRRPPGVELEYELYLAALRRPALRPVAAEWADDSPPSSPAAPTRYRAGVGRAAGRDLSAGAAHRQGRRPGGGPRGLRRIVGARGRGFLADTGRDLIRHRHSRHSRLHVIDSCRASIGGQNETGDEGHPEGGVAAGRGGLRQAVVSFTFVYLFLYLTGPRGLSTAQAGLIAGIGGIGMVAGNFTGGWYGDRFGHRRILLTACRPRRPRPGRAAADADRGPRRAFPSPSTPPA